MTSQSKKHYKNNASEQERKSFAIKRHRNGFAIKVHDNNTALEQKRHSIAAGIAARPHHSRSNGAVGEQRL